MAAHQYHVVLAQTARQITSVRRVRYQKIRVAEIIGDIPHWHMGSDKTSGVDDRTQRNARDSEGQCVLGMRVHDRCYVGPCFINAAVDESLNRRRTGIADRDSIQTEFYDIGALDNFRSR